MHAVQAFSLLALAGSTLAHPQGWGNWGGHKHNNNQPADDNVAVVTAYTTVTMGGNWGKPTPAPQPAADSSSWGQWSSAPVASSAPEAPSSGGYMGVVQQWRSKMGMSQLEHDSTLEGNAQKTAADGNGEMVHELNPGSMAQVLAPGSPDEFEKVFVGGWLCEVPSLPGLDGICSSMSQGWAYGGETGHADILSSTSYSKIGCSCETGIWACDLA